MKKPHFSGIIAHSWLALVLLASLLMPLTSFSAAKAASPGGAYIQAIQIDHVDNSVWVVSTEYADQPQMGRITHYTTDGKLVSQVIIPEFANYLGLVIDSDIHRVYYMQSHNGIGPNKVAYYNLDHAGDNGLVTNNLPGLDETDLTAASFSYNPLTKHFYAACCITVPTAGFGADQRVIIDVKTNTITSYMMETPVGYNPITGKLYAIHYYQPPANSTTDTIPYFDLITLDATTETVVGTKLLTKVGPFTTLHSLQINSKTGLVYVITRACPSSCDTAERAIFNQNNDLVQPATPTMTDFDYALNETTNQLYSVDEVNIDTSQHTVYNASDLSKGQQARLGWQPLAIDQVHNRVFGIFTDISDLANGIPGLSVLVADGVSLDVTSTLNVREPNADLKSKSTPLAQLPANFQGKFFPQTGHTLTGVFLDYWNAHGGLAAFGYPLTEPLQEYNSEVGRTLTVQYFERNRFELHPENKPPYNVLLGRLGATFGAQSGPFPTGNFGSGQTSQIASGILFAETGHTLTGKFYQYWQANGGLAIFGLPLTEPFPEVNPIDGKTYMVQYFERNRFELHPEFAGTAYEVELGLLGVQYMRAHGWVV